MYALKGAFGYSNALYGDYNYNTVLSELSQNKPVILAGGEKKYWAEGHAWVRTDICTALNVFTMKMDM
ncbi:conserved hypothetical protein [Flavobacterium psychrophilum]|nr:hypothetical protein [Flavobacterium psychrophilum]MCB6062569.1 hypothetical protein [Flavobacterium psychrophilum]SNB44301.1 conserved hypothetical protein [Flavobacterium psychrophilum]